MPRFLPVLAVLWSVVSAQAQTSLETRVGGSSLLLPIPDGFIEPSKSVPILRKNAEAITAPPMRLVAVFVDDEDRRAVEKGTPPSFRRYFLVQVLRAKEPDTLSETAFSDVKSQVAGPVKVSDELRKHIESAGSKVGAEAGIGDRKTHV